MALFGKKKEQQPVEWLIVGLGNPGAEYEQTRHNQGFQTIDILAQRLGASYWKTECKALTTLVNKRMLGWPSALLAKPQTFMNNSGRSVDALVKATEVDPCERLIIVHDELDIPAGEIRIKRGGGHAGHNGLRSIIDALGTKDFIRVRVGIGRPPGRMDSADYVLAALRPAQQEEAAVDAQHAADAVMMVMNEGLLVAQNFYHRDPEDTTRDWQSPYPGGAI